MKHLYLLLMLGACNMADVKSNESKSVSDNSNDVDTERPNKSQKCTVSIDETISVDVEYAYQFNVDDNKTLPDYINCDFYEGNTLRAQTMGARDCSAELGGGVIVFSLTSGSLELYLADYQDNRVKTEFECE